MEQTTLYTVTVVPMRKSLVALSSILKTAESHAESKKLSWANFESALLHDHIIFDQFPFVKQVQVTADNAKNGIARLAQIEAPAFEDTEATFAELVTRLDKTIHFLDTITPEQVNGKEGIEVTLPYFPDKHMTGFGYATEYMMPNFYFHLTTAYTILRKNGVAIGKNDFLGDLPFQG